jgi:beta-1,4-mannosyltransferase
MRILVGAPYVRFNPYCRELGGGYRAAGCDVAYGLDLFWTGHSDIDVVHLQWPEYLLLRGMRLPDDVPALHGRLAAWKRRAVVIATVHNPGPHDRQAGWMELYETLYGACDGIVHHGRRSQEWFAATFPALARIPSTVVPHGAYSSFPLTLSRDAAREGLGIRSDERVVLVFGQFRTTAELALVARGFAAARVAEKCLLLSSAFPLQRFESVRDVWLRLRYLSRLRHVLLPREIPARDVQRPFLAADLLLLQRHTGLNSGNLSLAFSFGLPVVTPDVGVFGERARDTGNFAFDPVTPEQAGRTLERAFATDLRELGRRNRTLAEHDWSWPHIAARLLDFARQLRARRSIETA